MAQFCAVIAFGAAGCTSAPRPPAFDLPARDWESAGVSAQMVVGAPKKQVGLGDRPRRYQEGDTELIGGIGLTGGPTMLLLGGEMSYHLDEDGAIGPLVQVGVSGDDTFLGVSFHYKHHFYLDEGGALSRFRPFAQGGLGFAYLDKGNRDGWSLLLHVGGGVQYHINPTTHLGSNILFDFLPNDPVGDSFIFAWQVVQIGFSF